MKKCLFIPALVLAATTLFAGCGGSNGEGGAASAEEVAALNATTKTILTSLDTQDFSVFTYIDESELEITTESNHSKEKENYTICYNKDIGYLYQKIASDEILEIWLYVDGSNIVWAKAQQKSDSVQWEKVYDVLPCSSHESALLQFPEYAANIVEVDPIEGIENVMREEQKGIANYVEAWSADSRGMIFNIRSLGDNAFDISMNQDSKRDDTAMGGVKEEYTSTETYVAKDSIITKVEGSDRHYVWEQWGNEEWQFAWTEEKNVYKKEFSLTCVVEKPDLDEFTPKNF